MKTTNIFTPISVKRLLALSITASLSLFIFGFAFTANAATLTRSLELGMSGADVSALQTYLAKDPVIYQSGLITGYFGQLTKAAVERFQTAQGIVRSGTPATTGYGRVGPVTIAALNTLMNGDSTSPSINSVNVNVTNNSSSLSWNTNENSSSVLYYATSPMYMIEGSATTGVTIGGSSVLVNTYLQASHSTTLSNLSSNTTYYYVIYVRDGFGNESITWPATFRTN